MRARNIKPAFWKNEDLINCDPFARLLFIGLWNFSDREGRFEWRPRKIKIEILPCDKVDIDSLLDQLLKQNLILKYSVNGNYYGWIPNFLRHQHPHFKEKPSEIPPYNKALEKKDVLGNVQARGKPETEPRQARLNPDILNPESLKKPTSGRPPHFSKAYQTEIVKKIEKAAQKLKPHFPEVFKFIQFNCKAKIHPGALCHVLDEMSKQNGIEDYWAYGIQLAKKYNWNFRDADRIAEGEKDKIDFNAFVKAIEITMKQGGKG